MGCDFLLQMVFSGRDRRGWGELFHHASTLRGATPYREGRWLNFYRQSTVHLGIAGAQSNLGLMYEKGQGVEQDYVEAHKWFNIAGVNGNDIGRKNMVIVEKKMTPSQIIASVALAKGWMEKL